MNEYALRTIEELRERSSSMFAWLWLQFSFSREYEADMLKIFKLCMGEMEIQMDRIIMEAQKCLQELHDLLETLDTLSAVLYREDKLLREEREGLREMTVSIVSCMTPFLSVFGDVAGR